MEEWISLGYLLSAALFIFGLKVAEHMRQAGIPVQSITPIDAMTPLAVAHPEYFEFERIDAPGLFYRLAWRKEAKDVAMKEIRLQLAETAFLLEGGKTEQIPYTYGPDARSRKYYNDLGGKYELSQKKQVKQLYTEVQSCIYDPWG